MIGVGGCEFNGFGRGGGGEVVVFFWDNRVL